MKYAVDMIAGAMICVPSLIKIGSGIQKLIGGTHSMSIAWIDGGHSDPVYMPHLAC
jgi:hypothetical protein